MDCYSLRLLYGAIMVATDSRLKNDVFCDKHCHLVGDGLAATVDGEGQRGLTVGDVLRAGCIERHGDGGIVEGAVTRGGPLQVVVVDGITHDLCVVAFADGHIVTSGASHDAGGGQADEVDPGTVTAAVHATILGVGPLVGVHARGDSIGGFGPADGA